MSKIIERCAGIDVGKSFLLCCVLPGAANEEPESETRRVDTTVPKLEQLREWLQKEDVTPCSGRGRDISCPIPPRTDPHEQNYRMRLLSWVCACRPFCASPQNTLSCSSR